MTLYNKEDVFDRHDITPRDSLFCWKNRRHDAVDDTKLGCATGIKGLPGIVFRHLNATKAISKRNLNNQETVKMNSAGDRSVISNDMQELRQGGEEISHKIQGHKANLSNPSKKGLLFFTLFASDMGLFIDTSQASKENSKREIEQLGGDDNLYGKEDNPRSKSAAEQLEGSRAST